MTHFDIAPIEPASPQIPYPLRIGVLLGSSDLAPKWICKILEDINRSHFLDLALIVSNRSSSRSFSLKALMDPAMALFNAWRWLDYHLFRAKPDALEVVDISRQVNDAQRMEVLPIEEGGRYSFQDADLAKIRAADLDVILHLGFLAPTGEILHCAKYGIWSFLNSSGPEDNGTLHPFWNMYEKNPITMTSLHVLHRNLDSTRVIFRSFSAADYGSLYRMQNAIAWRQSESLLRRLSDLHRWGWDYINSLDEPGIVANPSCHALRIIMMARFLTGWSVRALRNKARTHFLRDHWFIALRKRSVGPISPESMQGFKVEMPPADRFYADPFIVEREGKNYIFFEDYRYETAKGVISCVELDDVGTCSNPEVVLEKDYHLSYPFLFEWQGEIYLLPETCGSNRIEVYRSLDFPRRWVLEKVLLENICGLDSTIVEHGGKWWLFTADLARNGPKNDQLFLFFADSPFGDWKAHPKNPIVSDVRRARPAGQCFFQNGQLIRPGQDCSQAYGYAISLNRVELLSEDDYREVPVDKISPTWFPGIRGTHTFNSNNKFEVIDGRLLISRNKSRFALQLAKTIYSV